MNAKYTIGLMVFIAAAVSVNAASGVDIPAPLIWLKMDGNLKNSGIGSYTARLETGSSGLSTAYVMGRDGTAGGALRINSIDSGTTIANGAGNDIAISYKMPNTGTIALWYYKMDTVGSANKDYYQELFCNSAGNDKWEGWTSVSNADMGARINDDDWGGTGNNTVFPDSLGWHHLAFTWERDTSSWVTDKTTKQQTNPGYKIDLH